MTRLPTRAPAPRPCSAPACGRRLPPGELERIGHGAYCVGCAPWERRYRATAAEHERSSIVAAYCPSPVDADRARAAIVAAYAAPVSEVPDRYRPRRRVEAFAEADRRGVGAAMRRLWVEMGWPA